MKFLRWFSFLLVVSALAAEDVTIVELRDFRRREISRQGLTVARDIRVKIEAWGMSDPRDDGMLAYGWILDGETRRVVWEMTVDNSSEERGGRLRKTEGSIRLSPGKYEVYFAVSPRGLGDRGYEGLGDFLGDLFSGFRARAWRRDARSWGITILSDKKDRDALELLETRDDEGAIVRLAPLGDDAFEKEGFSLNRDVRLRVYAMGEGDNGEMVDYGWIVNAKTREKVWEMDYRSTRWSGGAEKNRVVDEEVVLPAGDYIVTFVTDGSHSYDDWNQLPPYDPSFWGITVWDADGRSGEALKVTSYNPEDDRRMIVDITRVGDDRFESKGFMLTKPTRVIVRCLGEYGSGGRFVDFGWIIDAKTREMVWEMTRRNTKHAGGAGKNRMFEDVLSLEQGSYEVYYLTDDSHSYRRWNAGPPYDPESWGIAVWVEGDDDVESVRSYDEEGDPDVLVRMIRMGDDERRREKFRLDVTADVRVYAIGEGDDDEMSDFGWIENERGRRVWRMEHRDTEHAGGARKNRMVNEVIRLEAGEYTVYFRTDGSHSFEDWNDDPPRDPVHWGIMVRRER